MGDLIAVINITANEHFTTKLIMGYTEHDAIREDRLRRNRESAKKCRLKRKAQASLIEDRLNALEAQNAQLLRENQALRLQLAGHTCENVADIPSLNHTSNVYNAASATRSSKRARREHENGAIISFDSSESAVFATSQQTEITLLAVMTTLLCSTHAPAKPAAKTTCTPTKKRTAFFKRLATRIIHTLRAVGSGPQSSMLSTKRTRPSHKPRLRPELTYWTKPPWMNSSSGRQISCGDMPTRMCMGPLALANSILISASA